MKTQSHPTNNSVDSFTARIGQRIGQRGAAFSRCNRAKFLAALSALLVTATVTVRASDPVGIYALVDKIALEPNENPPERIQIWGVFVIAEGSGNNYKPAERGYFYYKLNPDKPNVCRNEWSDLKAVAGTGQIVTFAFRYQEKGTLRKAGTKPENPDKYPIAMGLGKISDDKAYGPIKTLLALRDAQKKDKEKSGTSKNKNQ